MYGRYGQYGRYAGTSRACVAAGATGEDVVRLSRKLCEAGFGPGGTDSFTGEALGECDWLGGGSVFDAEMTTAVEAYQRANGLGVDGIAGPNTWAKMGETGAACPSSRRSSSSSSTALTTTGGSGGGFLASDPYLPFYKQKWFMFGIGGLALAGAVALFVIPKKKGKK